MQAVALMPPWSRGFGSGLAALFAPHANAAWVASTKKSSGKRANQVIVGSKEAMKETADR